MKKVRECNECGLYNKLTKTKCPRCGNLLNDIPVKEVDDDLSEAPDFKVKKTENPPEEEVAVTERVNSEQSMFRCKYCGEVGAFSAEESFVFCGKCRRMLLRKDVEWISEEESAKQESDHESIVRKDTPKSFSFESVLGKGAFVLTFTGERQVFGRHHCDKEFIINNKFISREHIIYFYRDGQAYLEDISNNGTFLNGERLVKGKEYAVKIGDRLKLSNEEFVIKNVD